MTDLTTERLDQYERAIESARKRGQKKRMIHLETWSALIAMARRAAAAERDRDALRDVLVLIADREPICDHDWAPHDAAHAALAQLTDAGGAE